MTDSDKTSAGIEKIAEGMWYLIRPSSEEDWEWCVRNEPGTAAELRYRARCALVRGGFLDSSPGESPARSGLDLRLKEAMIRQSLPESKTKSDM
jgi:DNA-binding transcriptional regulator PaaX